MKIQNITLNNFRKFLDEEKFSLEDLTVLVGSNNTGKSTIFDAIKIFYKYNKAKFKPSEDLPKSIPENKRNDIESWIQIEYILTDDEVPKLPEKYQREDNKLVLRKFLQFPEQKNRQKKVFAVHDSGEIDDSEFFGAPGVSLGKLGKENIVFIPGVSDLKENLKTSGPSPLREMVNSVFTKVAKENQEYNKLTNAFAEFDESIHDSETDDGLSLNTIQTKINEEMSSWNFEFDLNFSAIDPREMVKRLLTHELIDTGIEEDVDMQKMGLGLRRNLIFSLIKVSADLEKTYVDNQGEDNFSPEFGLILFEEPEAFLHPSQERRLNSALHQITGDNQQVIATTHSANFVSKNTEDLPSLVKLRKYPGYSEIYQIERSDVEPLTTLNQGLYQMLKEKMEDDDTAENISNQIENQYVKPTDTPSLKEKEEAMRYFMWMDGERAKAFFADKVLIVEGASEKTYIDFLIENRWQELIDSDYYVLDAAGKPNIPSYMNLFGELGIDHQVIMDKDKANQVHQIINKYVEDCKNDFTCEVKYIEDNFEDLLDIEAPGNQRKKAINVMVQHHKGNIDDSAIDTLKKYIQV